MDCSRPLQVTTSRNALLGTTGESRMPMINKQGTTRNNHVLKYFCQQTPLTSADDTESLIALPT